MRCLRPCQQVVSVEEYRSEVNRLVEFLASDGDSQLHSIASARDHFSEEMRFEDARRQHERYQRVEQVLRLRDELANRPRPPLRKSPYCRRPTRATVALRFFLQGVWLPESPFGLLQGGRHGSDGPPVEGHCRGFERAARSACGSGRNMLRCLPAGTTRHGGDGEWIPFPALAEMPYPPRGPCDQPCCVEPAGSAVLGGAGRNMAKASTVLTQND